MQFAAERYRAPTAFGSHRSCDFMGPKFHPRFGLAAFGKTQLRVCQRPFNGLNFRALACRGLCAGEVPQPEGKVQKERTLAQRIRSLRAKRRSGAE